MAVFLILKMLFLVLILHRLSKFNFGWIFLSSKISEKNRLLEFFVIHFLVAQVVTCVR